MMMELDELRCPACGDSLEWSSKYEGWYCNKCACAFWIRLSPKWMQTRSEEQLARMLRW